MQEYHPEKAVQAAAFIARRHGGRISKIRLLKLLYLADREVMAATGRSITGDRVYAMKHGPVLSRTYNRIKEEDWDSASWQRHLSTRGIDVRIEEPADTDHLSPLEIDALRATCKSHDLVDEWALVEETHQLPEWLEIYPVGTNVSLLITEARLREVLQLQATAAQIDAEDEDAAALDRLLASEC